MKKSKAISILAILILVGSFVTFYVTNFIMSDISNMFYGVHDVNFISSIPGFVFSWDFVLAVLYTIRYFGRSQHKKKMTLTYTVILMAFSVVGFVGAILSGTMIYHSFVKPYPFPGYVILSLIVHFALFVFAFILRGTCKKNMEEDTAKRRIDVGYILYSAACAVVIFLALNRFGALIWAVVYAQASTLYLTFPFYISLLLPLALVVQITLYIFGAYDNHLTADIVYVVVFLIVNTILAAAVFYLGSQYTVFISAISPALALERLATMPLDVIVHFGLMYIIGFYCLYLAIKLKKKRTKKA
ncbi:MAG: hypothetical protein MJ092_08080 [Lachnospiraceae bacterium]|nr:hypothetical protein [Lachnospiraceae bacterium]